MMFPSEEEQAPPASLRYAFDQRYRAQVRYLFERSPFYRRKLETAGFRQAEAVGGLDRLHMLPFTDKDELRESQSLHPPFGDFLAADLGAIRRIYSSSGTTGIPCYIAVTANDFDWWTTMSARSYSAAGIRSTDTVVTPMNAGPFVGGAALDSLFKIGATTVPVGSGNTERLVRALQYLKANALLGTPSYVSHLADWCRERNINTQLLGLQRILVSGEPGGSDPQFRAMAKSIFNASVCETLGLSDINPGLWGECREQAGMHFCGHGYVHFELIDPDTNEVLPLTDNAEGELVYTSISREAMPMLRFKSRDRVIMNAQPCSCGRTSIRMRCVGRTDDLLIVRGVNVFPTAVREIVGRFAPETTEYIQIRPTAKGPKQIPPLPIRVEVSSLATLSNDTLVRKLEDALRSALLVKVRVELVPPGTLPRSEYKSKLVDYTEAK
jgi:phenylacetate-CoA ligase